MKLLLQLMLCAVAIVIASAEPCSAAPQSRGGAGYVSSSGNGTFAADELNSPMMQEGAHKVAAADGQAVSQSLLGRGWGLVKEHPVVSLFILCLVLWLLFLFVLKVIRHIV